MKANTRYTVEIGQPVTRLIEVDSLEDARALLRACATHHTFLPAMCERDSGEPMDNEWLRYRPIPDEDVHSHFRERVGYLSVYSSNFANTVRAALVEIFWFLA